MDMHLLEKIGLAKSEVAVYIALLELGNSATGKIVGKSKVASSKIYEILDRLMQKGLVSFIMKSGVKYFDAAPPERIMDYMKEKEDAIKKQKSELKSIIPELEIKQKLSEYKSEATIFKGIKGGETAFRYLINHMDEDDEWVGFVIKFNDKRYSDLLQKLHIQRANKGLKSRIIMNEEAKNYGKDREKLNNTQVKYMSDDYQTPAIVNVAGDITLLNIMAKEVTVFMIESKEVADSFRKQFEELWNKDTTVSKGFGSLKKALFEHLNEVEIFDVIGAGFGPKGKQKEYRELFVEFHKERERIGKRARMLFQYGTESLIPREQHTLSDIKFLPYLNESPVAIFLADDNVKLVVQENEPTIIKINNRNVASAFRKNFNLQWDQETTVLKGVDAIQQLFDEMISYGQCDFIGARGYFIDVRSEFIDTWEKRAKKSGFKMRNIVDKDVKGHRITQFSFAQTKYTLDKDFADLSVYWIFGDKVVISNWAGNEPIVMVIKNKEIVRMYKKQFETLWKK